MFSRRYLNDYSVYRSNYWQRVSSDVGSLVIDISEGCRIYTAKVKKDGGSDKVVLYDEEWNHVGREIEIK